MKTITTSLFILFLQQGVCQLSWVNETVLTTQQKVAIAKFKADNSWEAQGTVIGKIKLFYDNGSNDIESVRIVRTVALPSVSVPALIGGYLKDDDRFGFQFNPLVGLGMTFRRESITTDGTEITTKHKLSFQPMILLYKYAVDKNRYGAAYGMSVTFFNYLQLGYAYSDRRMPNYGGNHLFLVGLTVPITGLLEGGGSEHDQEAK